MKNLLIIIVLLSSTLLLAQPPRGGGKGGMRGMKWEDRPEIGKISGKVLDAETKLPIEFATITLRRMKDTVVVGGGVTDTKGNFLIDKVKVARYFVDIDFMGYERQRLDRVMIHPRQPEKLLGTITLAPSATLQDVQITAEKAELQIAIDKKVFNVEKSIVSEGGSATEILENVPSVEVDIDGNVSLRGSGNVTILIDGKPSGLLGASRSAILDAIPASSIKSVELITSPSAKYDPDGTAGIINIVLKKDRKKGFNGVVSAGIGLLNQYNGSLSLNYRTTKFNLYTSYGYRYSKREGSGEGSRQTILSDTTFYLDHTSDSERKRQSHAIRTGADFYVNPTTTLSIGTSFKVSPNSRNEFLEQFNLDENRTLISTLIRDNEKSESDIGGDIDLGYQKRFKQEGQKLDASVRFGFELEEEKQKTAIQDGLTDNQIEENKNNITIGQIDYTHPLSQKSKIETGYKTIIRNVNNRNFDDTDTLLNDFKYKEQVHAVYGTYGQQIKKFGYKIGLRLEQAFTNSSLVTNNQSFENNYFSFFPSLHLSQKLSNKQELTLSYNRRINRPRLRALNPLVDIRDPLNIRSGNPFLKPEYINAVELGYTKYFKNRTTLTSSLYYRYTTDVMSRIKRFDAETGVSEVTYDNFATSQSYGLEVIANWQVLKWWRIMGNLNAYRYILDGSNLEADLDSDAFGGFARATSTMKVWKDMTIQLSGFYRTPRRLAQGQISQMFTLNGAIKKSILNKRGSITFRVSDIFNTRRFEIDTEGDDFKQSSKRQFQSRIFYLSFSYRFGKVDKRQMRRGDRDGGNRGGDDFGGGLE